jgi:hypothetical protein
MLCTNVLEPSSSLESGCFVDNVQDQLATNVHNVNNDIKVKLDVIS